jgi:DNA-binding PadR family transcriptional regulator
MIEIAILGLLLQQPLHGYRLKQQLDWLMSGCISVNYGTIYPVLKRLEQQGAISVQREEQEGADPASRKVCRKIYSLTDQGRSLWQQKMLEHPQESWVNAYSRFMIKFFFFSHLTPSERLRLIEHRLLVSRLRLQQQQQTPLPADAHQVAAWQKFIGQLENEICWLEKQFAQTNQLNGDSLQQQVSAP